MVTKKPEITFESSFPGEERPTNEKSGEGTGHGRGGKRYETDRCNDKDIIVMPGVTYYGGDINAKKDIESMLKAPLEVE